MRCRVALTLGLVAAGLLLPREAIACGVGMSWVGGGERGGLWQRPARKPAFEPGIIVLMGNEALGIPAGVEVDVTPPPEAPPSPLARLIASLQHFPGWIDFDSERLAAFAREHG